MTTSGTYVFTVNRDQIIRDAMLNIGKLDDTEIPTAQEVSDCNFKLNCLVKQWMGKTDFAPGLKVWKRRRGYLFLSSATGQYSIGQTSYATPNGTGWTNSFTQTTVAVKAIIGAGSVTVSGAAAAGLVLGSTVGIILGTNDLNWFKATNVVGNVVTLSGTLDEVANVGATVYVYQAQGTQPLTVETATLRDSNNSDTPLKIMTVQEYDFLPNKADPTNISDPTAIYYEFQLGNSNLFTDCGAANDTTKYLSLTYLEAVQDIVNPADNFVYPQEWFLALSFGLAKIIAPMFNAPWTANLESAHAMALSIAGHKDPERSSMYFQTGGEE